MRDTIETVNIKGDKKDAGWRMGSVTYRTTGNKWEPFQALERSGRPRSHGYDSGSEGSRSVKTTKINPNKRVVAENLANRKAKQREDYYAQKRKAVDRLNSKERSLREARKANNQKKTYGSSTERFKALMKQKEQNKKISEQLKNIRKRKQKLLNTFPTETIRTKK